MLAYIPSLFRGFKGYDRSTKDETLIGFNKEDADYIDPHPTSDKKADRNDKTTRKQSAKTNGVSKDAVEDEAEATKSKGVKESVKGTGIITVLKDTFEKGVIDGIYLFSKEKFCNIPGCQFQEGMEVDFEAEKYLGDCTYNVVALKAHLKLRGEENPRLTHYTKYVGKVIEVFEDTLSVEIEHSLHAVAKYHLPVYIVKPGDLLRFTVKKDDDGEDNLRFADVDPVNIVKAEPTKMKTLVGKLVRRKTFCVIDGNIFCSEDVFGSKTFIPSGVLVKVKAVESEQSISTTRGKHTFPWRATEVEMSAFATYMKESVEETAPEVLESLEQLRQFCEDRHGIQISPKGSINFGSLKIGVTSEKEVEIANTSYLDLTLVEIRIVGEQSVCSFEYKILRKESDHFVKLLKPGERFLVKIYCKPTGLGRTKELCIFDFGNFKIGRHLCLTALSSDTTDIDQLKKSVSEMPIKKKWKSKKKDEMAQIVQDLERNRIRGTQPVRAPFFMPKRLPTYPIPKVLFKIFQTENENMMQKEFPKAMNPLTFDNYKEKFSVCLWFEELENDRRRRESDLRDITLTWNGEFFTVKVPGLKDLSPPIQLGDPLDVFDASNTQTNKYEGFVHRIADNTIFIKFDEQFQRTYRGEKLTVQFRIGRMTYKRSHFAVETAVQYLGRDFLFPKEEDMVVQAPRIHFIESEKVDDVDPDVIDINTASAATACIVFSKRNAEIESRRTGNLDPLNRRVKSLKKPFISNTEASSTSVCNPSELKWFNKMLNEEQKNGVRRILMGEARPVPYIIFGPPGTGKTVTVVEAVMQINTLDRNSRILVCAPSNAAADVIALHLIKSNNYSRGDFIRFNGFMRSNEGSVPDEIKEFCMDGDNLESVVLKRIVISTCVTAGQFFQLNLEAGHFTHVFVDEAGYCTEPETLIPSILLALNKGGQLILAGDPFQLGPVLMSDAANNCGMHISFLQRLMDKIPLYQRNPEKFPGSRYNPLGVTKLVKNYRTHETLLKIPSQLFYDDELEACASYEGGYALCQNAQIAKEVLVAQGVPIVFHGIQGNSVRDPDSPSWFNTAEILEVVKYVKALKRCGLSNDDIGIITPYRKQVEKIKTACMLGQLRMKENEVPKVGSVEEFQGGERQVVIISTVRSIYEDKIDKSVHRLGFIFSPKRFNVSLTRAKSLLIVIGNPHILCRNRNWRTLLIYCKELGTYQGCNLPLQLEPKYLNELKKAKEETNTVALAHPPDKASKHYNPDGIDSDDYEDV